MKINCKTCSQEFNRSPSEIKKSLNHFCSKSCSATFNNTFTKIKEVKLCLNCTEPLKNRANQYCDVKCQHNKQRSDYIQRWKDGKEHGVSGKSTSSIIKNYMLEKSNYKCSICNWSEINPYTKTLPLELEHIDGDYTNNREENLSILCPNCHALTKTYRGANVGNSTRTFK